MIASKLDRASEESSAVSISLTDSASTSTDSVERLTGQVARGSTWMLVGSLFGRISQFALHVLLSRVLGASNYGLYAMGRSVMHFMQQFGGLGLPAGVVRFGAAEHGQGNYNQLKGTLISSLAISALSSGLIAAVIFIWAGWISTEVFNKPEFKPVLRIFSVSLPFFVLNFVASRIARAFRQMKYDVLIGTIAQPTTNFILLAIAFGLGYGLGGAVYAFLFATVLSAFFGIYAVNRLFPFLSSSVRAAFAVPKLMKYSLTVLGAGLSTVLLGETDRIMLGMLTTAADVGVYNVAVLVSTQTVFFLTAVNSSFMPMIADLYHRKRHIELHELFRITTRWIFIFSVPLLLIILIYPSQILGVFGSEFTVGTNALMLLCIAYFIDAAVGPVGYLLQMSDYHHILAINNVAMACINIVLNYFLINEFGIVGAAIATGIAISVINVVKLIQVRMLLGMHPYDRTFWKPTVAGLAGALTGFLILYIVEFSWAWLVGVLGIVLTYVGLLYLFGVESRDRSALESLLSRRRFSVRANRASDSAQNGRSGAPDQDGLR